MKLKSKTALISGAGRGIGEAMAYAFAGEGANLSLSARTFPELEKVKSKAEKLGAKVTIEKCDVSKPGEVKKWVERSLKEFGRIDILVNNAGIYGPIGLWTDNDLNTGSRRSRST